MVASARFAACKRLCDSLLSGIFLCLASGLAMGQADDLLVENPEEAQRLQAQLLGEPTQLTFDGKTGEGYFSADGKQIVFQSEREPGNPFYQIYLMDRENGDLRRISPGVGKTTCAWIHPSGDKVMFASTQFDPEAVDKQRAEIEFRESGQQRRYSWDYDETFDIVTCDVHTGEYERLTTERGYDAEGSYSPDGEWICFASNRRAYTGEMTEKEKRLFAVDPASAMDLYIMRSDGSELRRLTTAVGYDGGPFFSPDGKQICWRRFSENGATAEIMLMNVDGTNERAITRLEAMSWAPYFHPSGDYLIFASNLYGFGNFELFLVDADGSHEPVRVTYREGFDGLPVFTPDGKSLVWTSNGGLSKSQLFETSWNDSQARSLLGLKDADAESVSSAAVAANAARLTAPGFKASDVGRHVDYLCRPELGGRLTGTQGELNATSYVAAYLESLGLQPAGRDGTFFHEFEFISDVELGNGNRLSYEGRDYKVDQDWRPVFFSKEGKLDPAEVVCAGYGIVAPATEEFDEFDSYVHLDVADKWVMVFRQMPQDISAEHRQSLARYSGSRYKAMVARDRGAKGLIFVSGPTSQIRQRLMPLRMDGSLGGSSLAVISVSDAVASDWMTKAGKDLKEIQASFDTGEPQMGFLLEGVRVGAEIEIDPVSSHGRNVLAWLPAGETPSSELVVVGAHIDHLGKGGAGGSLAKDDEVGGIHRGADDNASGVGSVLEMAQYLADEVHSGRLKMKRDILFAAWSGEELGLRGSQAFADDFADLYPGRSKVPAAHAHHGASTNPHAAAPNPHAATSNPHAAATNTRAPNPHAPKEAADTQAANPHATVANPHATAKNTESEVAESSPAEHSSGLYPAIAACINLDMVGRLREKLVLQGLGSSTYWKGAIGRRNAIVKLPLTLQDDCHLPTDAHTFFLNGVPILSAFTGSHSEYHTPRDVPELLNYEGAAKTARLMALITRDLVLADHAPEFQDQEAEPEMRANLTAYLGSVPDYAQEEIKGVKLSGVTKGAPASKAGIQAGDIIVELAGRKIENIYDYTYAIEALKVGQQTTVKVQRGEEVLTLDITPASRQ